VHKVWGDPDAQTTPDCAFRGLGVVGLCHPATVTRVEPATEPWLAALAQSDDVFTARFGIAVVAGWAGFS
jgi:hypothetical protein